MPFLAMLVSVPRRGGSNGLAGCIVVACWSRIGCAAAASDRVLAAVCSPHATPSWWQHCNENGFAPRNVVDRMGEVREIACGFKALTPNAVS
jgi:hypothetical protein